MTREDRTPTVLRATGPADLLAALPRLTGMDAPESCFIVMFDGSRTIGAARLDLPEDLDAQLDSPMARLAPWMTTAARIAAHGPGGAVVVVKTASRLTKHPEASAHGALTASLAEVIAMHGIEVRDALVLGSDGWASFGGGTERPDLNWLEDIEQSPLHDPDHEPATVEDWRAQHPGQTADSPEEIQAIADRMKEARQ